METYLINIVRSLLGLILGGCIGLGFGLIQQAALRRHAQLQENGKMKIGWTVMPGSMRRVAYLLIALALVQVISPALFQGGVQWWVSAGVAGGYGGLLLRQLRGRRTSGALVPSRHG
ncbi:MAG: hypothetical protein WC485_11950 [Opitutaceae bacterium]